MSAGMKVMCSIFEGHVKGGLQECVTKALQGNQLQGVASYEETGGASFLPPGYTGYVATPGATPYDYYSALFASPPCDNPSAIASAKSSAGSSPSWGSIPGFSSAFNGYTWAVQDSGYGYYWGLAKNTTGFQQPYFIARIRVGGNPNGDFAHRFPSGIICLNYKLELITAGEIDVNKVIGSGQDIDLPMPPDPWPFVEINNNAYCNDFYYAVIGSDPSTWASANGWSFGTHTVLTT